MIKPTVGRMLHYYLNEIPGETEDPRAAIIVQVIDDRHVNVVWFNQQGVLFQGHGVTLLQDDDKTPLEPDSYVAWMPYQKQVAAGEIPPTLHAR